MIRMKSDPEFCGDSLFSPVPARSILIRQVLRFRCPGRRRARQDKDDGFRRKPG
jgi:hypothetical protein